MLGRAGSEDRPAAPNGGGVTSVATGNFDDNVSQLERVEHRYNGTGARYQSDNLYAYDEFGDQTYSALDVNNDQQIGLGTQDRVTMATTGYQLSGLEWWRVTSSSVFGYNADPNGLDVVSSPCDEPKS